jgi:hypothetical protein
MRALSSLLLNAAAALLVLGARPVLAQHQWAIFVEDTAASGAPCVTAAALASGVTALTGATLVELAAPESERPAQVEHVIAARLSRHDDRVTLVLALHDASDALVGERVLERPADQCSALREAAVLAVMVMIGQSLPAPVEAPAPATPSAKMPRASEQPAAAPKDEKRARLSWQLFAGGGAAGNVVPGVTPHALLGARLTNALPWPLELSASFFGQSEAELGAGSEGRAEFSPLYALLTTCPFGAGWGALRVDACVGLLGGVALTSATDFTLRNRKGTQPLVGIVLRLPISMQLAGPFFVRASASVGTPLIYSRTDAIDSELQRQKLTETAPVFAAVDLALGLVLF